MDLYGYRRIWFDVGTANESLAPIVLSAGDHDGRIVAVRLWDGAAAVSGTGLTARLLFNDGTGGSGGYATMSAVSGEATAAWEVAVPTEALTPGHSTMSIEISQGQTIVCSRLIDAFVEPSVIDGDAPEAQDALAEFRAAVARLEDFTVPVPVGNGGTGKTSHTSNSVLTGNGTGNVKNVATKSGALYATANNGAASFGTLPVAQGGTGSTSAADALTALGAVAKAGDTMTGDLVLSNSEVRGKSTALTDGGSATGYGNGALALADSADATIGYIRPFFNAAGQWVTIYPRRGAGNVNELRLGLDANGNALVAFSGTGAQAAWLTALGLPAITDAAAWLSALGLTVQNFTNTSLITPDETNGFSIEELRIRKYGANVAFRTVIKRSTAIPVATTNLAVGTLASAYRPGYETVLDLRAYAGTTNLAASTAVITGGGVIQLRIGTQVPANYSLAITGNWILAS